MGGDEARIVRDDDDCFWFLSFVLVFSFMALLSFVS